MNSENTKTSKPHVLIINLTEKLDLRRGEKSIPLSHLSICYTWKSIKSSYNNNTFKIAAPKHGVKSLSYLMDHVLYQIFEIILSIF